MQNKSDNIQQILLLLIDIINKKLGTNTSFHYDPNYDKIFQDINLNKYILFHIKNIYDRESIQQSFDSEREKNIKTIMQHIMIDRNDIIDVNISLFQLEDDNGFQIINPSICNRLIINTNNQTIVIFPNSDINFSTDHKIRDLKSFITGEDVKIIVVDTQNYHCLGPFNDLPGGNIHCLIKQRFI
jgi:hypothetical protein